MYRYTWTGCKALSFAVLLVVAVQDPPAGALQTYVYLPLLLCEP